MRKRINVALVIAALLIGFATAWSTEQWLQAAERGEAEVPHLKEDFLKSAGLFELHNQVYSQVGERAWEDRVKPQFLSDVTYATVRETGKLMPEARDMIDWVRAHPEEARRLLQRAAGIDPAVK